MRKNLLEFLFGPAAVRESSHTLGEDVVKLFEEAADEETEQMVANKKPLAAALKDIGISNEVVEGPQWCEIHCDDEAEYRKHVALLRDPDNMHKLAERGWVFALCGDQAMSNEPPSFKIGFIELKMLDLPGNKQDAESLETVIKNAQKFATTPLDREDDDLNPVETDKKSSDDNQKGVGKPKDGADPKGKIKDSLTAKDLARRLLDDDGLTSQPKVQEMTSASAVPAVEAPMGVPARKRSKQKAEPELKCPKCGASSKEHHISRAFGHKLNKCWNCHTAFD